MCSSIFFALYGAIIGSTHGGLQIISSALKLPALYLLTLLICLPTTVKSTNELQTAFGVTKNSLLRSIELEVLIYNHQTHSDRKSFSSHNRYQLLTNLEHNLVNLSLLDSHADRKYQEIFTEAVDLGLSIHKEMRKIDDLGKF